MSTPTRKPQRITAGIVLFILAAATSGCAARAEYVYDEPGYRRERVYSAPPPVVVYRDRGYYDHRPPPARVYRAPARHVDVYRAPIHRHSDHDHHHHHDR